MVGPWQVPVANCGITAASYDTYHGETMAMGERTPVALLDFAASARLAVAANWMSAAGHPGEDAGLYAAVKAIGEELCPALEVTIPVGKDSMSMKTKWQQNGSEQAVTSPMSLVITAFGRVEDIRKTVTPQLRTDKGASSLLLIDLGQGANRLGASCLTQVYKQLGDTPADLDSPDLLLNFFAGVQQLLREQKLLAYHDRSDGGLVVTLAEMAFAGKAGFSADIANLGDDDLAVLFNEEPGAVIQVADAELAYVRQVLAEHNLADCSHILGPVSASDKLTFRYSVTAAPACVVSGPKPPIRCRHCVITRPGRCRNSPVKPMTPILA